MKKMKFLLDVDGIAADLIGHILTQLNEEFPDVVKPHEMVSWELFDFKDTVFTPQQLARAIEILDTPGSNYSFPLIEGAVEGYNKIIARGHEIRWLTSSWRTCPTWEYDRRNWIKKYFGTHKYDICFYHNKWEVMGDLLIDDKIENIELWSAATGGRGLLYDQPWNRHASPAIEKFDWSKTDELLDSLKS